MTWLQGGPFLEVSSVLSSQLSRNELINHILVKLNNLDCIIYMEESIDSYIEQFLVAKKFDEEISYHSCEVNVYIDIAGQRKSTIYIEEIAVHTFSTNLCFYGSEFDALEWNQLGIRQEEYIFFVELLKLLYREFKFVVGAVAYENEAKYLIEVDKAFPHEDYHYMNYQPTKFLNGKSQFRDIVCNRNVIVDRSKYSRSYYIYNIDNDGLHFKMKCI